MFLSGDGEQAGDLAQAMTIYARLYAAERSPRAKAQWLERIAADLLQVQIEPTSRLHGVEVGELRLPVGSSVSLVVREGRTMVPDFRTTLRHGDELLVVTPRRQRQATEKRLRELSTRGRLAQWLRDEPE